METKKRERKKIYIIYALSSVLLAAAICILLVRSYDPSKPNIFEIPGSEISEVHQTKKYYMIQRLPSTESELLAEIDEYMKDKIPSEEKKHNHVSYYCFMVPSLGFPVSFEEGKSFWTKEKHVQNYEATNRVATAVTQQGRTDYTLDHENISSHRYRLLPLILIALVLMIGCLTVRLSKRKEPLAYSQDN